MSKSELKIHGGDKVRLKDGRIVEVADIRNKHIMVNFVEWYSYDEVDEIVSRLRNG